MILDAKYSDISNNRLNTSVPITGGQNTTDFREKGIPRLFEDNLGATEKKDADCKFTSTLTSTIISFSSSQSLIVLYS